MIVRRTSPAKTFPKSLKEKEIILDISDRNSRIPTKKFIGLLKFKNFPICLKNPNTTMPKKLVAKTARIASIKVKFKSLAGDLKTGIVVCSVCITKEPTPGSRPNQLEARINRKIVAIRGKYFSDFFLSPKMESIKPKRNSIINSKIL